MAGLLRMEIKALSPMEEIMGVKSDKGDIKC